MIGMCVVEATTYRYYYCQVKVTITGCGFKSCQKQEWEDLFTSPICSGQCPDQAEKNLALATTPHSSDEDSLLWPEKGEYARNWGS